MTQRDLSKDPSLAAYAERNAPVRLDPARITALTLERTASARTERKVIPMKRNKKQAVVIALAAVLVLALSVAALASSGIIRGLHSESVSDSAFTSLPTEAEAMNEAGFVPVIVDRFANGYAFSNGWLMENDLLGDNRSVEANIRSYVFNYELPEQRGEKESVTVSLSEIPWHEGETVSFIDGTPADTINGITVFTSEVFWEYEDGQRTGDVDRSVSWQQGELQCALKSHNGLALDELLKMARELIEQS